MSETYTPDSSPNSLNTLESEPPPTAKESPQAKRGATSPQRAEDKAERIIRLFEGNFEQELKELGDHGLDAPSTMETRYFMHITNLKHALEKSLPDVRETVQSPQMQKQLTEDIANTKNWMMKAAAVNADKSYDEFLDSLGMLLQRQENLLAIVEKAEEAKEEKHEESSRRAA